MLRPALGRANLRLPSTLPFSTMSIASSRAAPSAIHNVARGGFDASGGSGLYDRARPSYPPAAISAIIAEATPEPASPLRIVELGAGTGIATRMLLAAATSTAGDGTPPAGLSRFTAIEPSAGMRSHFESAIVSGPNSAVQTLQGKGSLSPNVDVSVEDGAFEDFDAGNNNDAVVIAQAWHWCQDFDQALAQIAQTLRPGGILALIWNLENREAAPWVAQIRDVYERFEDNAPQYRHMAWKAMYNTPSFAHFFIADEPRHYDRNLPTNIQGVLDRVLSKSYISLLTHDQQEKLKNEITDYLGKTPDQQLGRKWVDQHLGVWEYPYRTDLYIFRRK